MMAPEGSVSERMRSDLEELGLGAMAPLAPEYSALVAAGSKSFPEAMPGMADAQVAAVRERDLGRRIEKASFPCVKTLRDFGFSFQPSLRRAEVEELATLGFLERHENVLLVGNPGTGKTHLAVSLGVEAVKARKLTCFAGCQRLVSDLERAADKGQPERRMRLCSHLSLLVIDEVGCLEVGKRGADLLFQLVPRRYERRPTTVTTNVGTGSWAKAFGDPVVASAIADRLCHHCTLLRITGRSYRMKGLVPEDAGAGRGKEGRDG